MFKNYRILIFSENPDKLMAFYRDVLGMKLENKLDIPNDYGYMFEVAGELKLWIGKHSEVNGKVKEPFRHIFNLFVESVSEWYKKIENNNEIKIILKPSLTPFASVDNQVYVCTFLDPEDNCWQFMGGE